MKIRKELRVIIDQINSLPVKGPGRVFPDQMKIDIPTLYVTLSPEEKNYFMDNAFIHETTIYRWRTRRNRTKEYKKYSHKDARKTKNLTVNSSSASAPKVIGTTLKTMIEDMSDYDIVKQSTMVETLHEAGYDKLSVMKTMGIPSPEEFETIMNAVRLLSKDYIITKKDT